MLIHDIDPDALVWYENYLRSNISNQRTRFDNLDSLNAEEFSNLVYDANSISNEVRRREAFLADRSNYISLHHGFWRKNSTLMALAKRSESLDRVLGANHYTMDSAFVTDMISMGYFRNPRSPQLGNDLHYPLRGGASSMTDILYAIRRSESKYRELQKSKFIVNVQESDDWELLALVGHLTERYMLPPLRLSGMQSYRQDARPLSKYGVFTYGSHRAGVLGDSEPSPLNSIRSFKEAFLKARAGVTRFREAHKSFLFFEVLLVNDRFMNEKMKRIRI